MNSGRPLVSVVDDDAAVRESLPDLLGALGFSAEVFASAEAFLESSPIGRSDCLILDVSLPGVSGPELQRELQSRGARLPVIFITAQSDQTLGPELFDLGPVQCLFKPFSETALLEALEAALGAR